METSSDAHSGAKKPRRESLGDAITGVAVMFAKVLKESSTSPKAPRVETPQTPCVETSATGISLGKTTELRMKNLEQFRYLQNLFEDGILTEKEHPEQKILPLLRKL